jgi:hypothetical protein
MASTETSVSRVKGLDPLPMLRNIIHINFDGSAARAARHWGVTPSFVSQVLRGVKLPNATMLAECGLKKVIAYRWEDENEN